MTAFNEAACVSALTAHGTYMAGGNLFWIDLTSNVQHGVPCNSKGVAEIMTNAFNSPPLVFPHTISVGVLDKESPSPQFGRLTRISPEEVTYAFLLAASRDLRNSEDDDGRAQMWRQTALNVPFQFILCESHDARYWKSINIRESIGVSFSSMYRTCVQRLFEINQWRVQEEQKLGHSMSAQAVADTWMAKVDVSAMGEAITVGYVDASMTVWNRLMSDPTCRDHRGQIDLTPRKTLERSLERCPPVSGK